MVYIILTGMNVFRHITPILDKHDIAEHTILKYKLLRNAQ